MPGGQNEQQQEQQQQQPGQQQNQPQPQPNPQPQPQAQPNPNPQPGAQPQADPYDPNYPSIDDILNEGNLNINEIAGEAQQNQPRPRGLNDRRTEAKFRPDPRTLDQILAGVDFALDADGVRYEGKQAIENQLRKKDSRLFLFNAFGDLPVAVENRGGKLHTSDDGISSNHQLPGTFFVPSGSLEPRSITGGATPEKIKKANDDFVKAKRAYDEKSGPYLREKEEYEKQLKELEKEKPQRTVKKPEKPSFSTGSKIRRWAFKFITLGFGETSAYKKYQSDLARYDRYMLGYKASDDQYKEELKAFNAKKNELIAKKSDAETELEELRQPVKRTEEYLKRVTGENPRMEQDIRKIRNYRDNLEVKLEGAADLVAEGRITRNNIFANTWMKKAACEGKDPSDPKAMEALEEYVASKMVEDKLLLHMMSGQLANPEDTALIDALNSGKATAQLRSDPVWMNLKDELIDDFEGELIDPEDVYKQMQKGLAEKVKEDKSPVKRLTDAKKALIDSFGKKPVTDACADDIMRLNVLNRSIKLAKEDPKFSEETAKFVLSDLHLTTGKPRVVMMDKHRDDTLRDAVKATAEQQGDKPLDLEEMTKLVNKNRKAPQNEKEEEIRLPEPG